MRSSCLFCLISTALLLCLKPTISLKRLHFGHCVILVNIHEIRHSFAAIKELTQSKDEHTEIRILDKSYSLQDTEQKVSTCPCGEDVKHKCGQIRSQYEKMDVHTAALKALGELDILLDWLDKAD